MRRKRARGKARRVLAFVLAVLLAAGLVPPGATLALAEEPGAAIELGDGPDDAEGVLVGDGAVDDGDAGAALLDCAGQGEDGPGAQEKGLGEEIELADPDVTVESDPSAESDGTTLDDGDAADPDVEVQSSALEVSNPRVVADSTAKSGQVTTWDCVYFGSYPADELEPGDAEYAGLESLEDAAWDANGDTTVDGVRYRRISKDDATYGGYWSKDGYGSVAWRYFRFEAIRWRTLEVSGTTALVVADVALDDQRYNANYTDVTWGTSSIRSFLNGYGATSNQPGADFSGKGFIDTAFSPDERSAIIQTNVANANNTYNGTNGGGDTEDEVFLLSEAEAYDAAHGFASSCDTYDEARRCQASDYAHAMGAWRSTDSGYEGNCRWLLRSPGGDTRRVAYVCEDGYVNRYGCDGKVYEWDYDHVIRVGRYDSAVRPALYLDLSSPNLRAAGTTSSGGTAGAVGDGHAPASAVRPVIGVTCVSAYGNVRGRVFCADGDASAFDPSDYRIAMFIQFSAEGGYIPKTTYAHPFCACEEGGLYNGAFTSGGQDYNCKIIHLFLVSRNYTSGELADAQAQAFDHVRIERGEDGDIVVTPEREVPRVEITSIELGQASYTYDGNAKKPSVTVRASDVVVPAYGYDVSYGDDNVNAGTATVTVTGKDSYVGTATATFTIRPRSLSSATVSGVTSCTYDGSAQVQDVVVKLGGLTLVEGTDYDLIYEGNVDAGTASVTVTGKGNYSGTLRRTFAIEPTDLSTATVSGFEARIYDGSAQAQSLKVELGGRTLVEGTDYDLIYEGNVDAGTASVTVTGKGNYSGTLRRTFAIEPADLSTATVSGITRRTYDGSGQEQNPTVELWGRTLKRGTEYALSYRDNVDAGTATVVVTGIGNFSGTATATFAIEPANLSSAEISGVKRRTYGGEAQTQSATVKVDGRTLKEGTDYTLSYRNNVNAGTATVIVAGVGNYSGTATATFVIDPVSLASATVSGVTKRTYDGSAQEQEVVVKLGDLALKEGVEYVRSYEDNVDAGTATLTITGTGNYAGSLSKTFAIEPADLSSAEVTGVKKRTYTGKAQTQSPTMRVGGRTLVKGTEYVLSYKDNVNAGTATLIVTGTGNYSGSLSRTFTIEAADLSAATVNGVDARTYDGSAQEQDVVVKLGSRTLKEGVDYGLTYDDNVDVGDATVTVTGRGNYVGTVISTFVIEPASLASATVKPAKASFVYDGTAKRPTATVVVGGNTLKRGVDYTTSYKNNVRAGTATITVTGRGNYSGTATAKFAIAKAANPMTAAAREESLSVTYSPSEAQAIEPNVEVSGAKGKVTYANASADEAKEFTVDAATGAVGVPEGTEAGTYAVTIEATAAGDANHKKGSQAVSFEVVVAKAANTIAAKAVGRSASAKKLKKKAVTVAAPLRVSQAQGKVTYAKASGAKQLAVNAKTGKVTVKKGTKKGTYAIKVKATAAGDANYQKGSKTVTCKVVVK